MAPEDQAPGTEAEQTDTQPPVEDVVADQPPATEDVADESSDKPVAPAVPADAVASTEQAPPESPAPGQPGDEAAAGRTGGTRPDRAQSAAPPAVPAPGAHLEVDIVPEGVDPLAAEPLYSYGDEEPSDEPAETELIEEIVVVEPIEAVAIDLAAGARYHATGKRKTAIARVILRPGTGTYTINGRTLEAFFPRATLQRNIRQPLETVGYEERMDVIARMNGGGVSAQAGALRHGISRALLEADPNLRGELKRRGFLTRDARAKERKKAGLKKARKRPQFSKR
jgi:small subunit ribosomal protein S9